jgi:hypothetical protein
MNIGNYEYVDQPVTTIKKFGIHPLSEDGVSRYFDGDSYTHKYLKSLSPQRVEDIFNYGYSPRKQGLVQTSDLISEEENNRPSNKRNKEITEIVSPEISNLSSPFEKKKLKPINSNFSSTLAQSCSEMNIHSSISSPRFQLNPLRKTTNDSLAFYKNIQPKGTISENSLRKLSSSNFKSLSPLRIKQHQGIKNIKFAEFNDSKYKYDYSTGYKTIKSGLNFVTSQNFNPKSPSFKSYEIPRTDQLQAIKSLTSSPRAKMIKNRMELAIEKSSNCERENEKMKNYLNNVIVEEETSNRTHRFPKISTITTQRSIKNIKIKTGTRDMGEVYNPHNFDLKSINKTKRNLYGSLFHH